MVLQMFAPIWDLENQLGLRTLYIVRHGCWECRPGFPGCIENAQWAKDEEPTRSLKNYQTGLL